MPIISQMTPDERRSDHYHILLDSGDDLLLHEALVVSERLGPGDTLTEEDVARLRAAQEERAVFDRAANLLASRPRSRLEMRRRLLRPTPKRPAPPEAAVDRALDRLERMGYLDDTAFAAYWTEQRDRFSPRSARALRQELRQRGVEAEVAAASADPDDDEARALHAARKRLRGLEGADYQTFLTRLGGYLQRRGFGYGVTRVVVRALWEETRGATPGGSGDEAEYATEDE